MNAEVSPADDGRRPDSPVHRIDAACDRFEAAWRAGRQPRIEDFLAGADAVDRQDLLRGLLELELELRRSRGESPTEEEYLARFPAEDETVRAAFGMAPPEGAGREWPLSEWLPRWRELRGRSALIAGLCAGGRGLRTESEVRRGPLEELEFLPDNGNTANPARSPGLAPEELSSGWSIGDYEILGELGRGGMGVVYRARHLPTGEVVALKALQRLSPDTLYRFKQEFRLVAGLAHPNLITLRELVGDGASWFFTMELLDAVDLRRYVRGTAATPHPASGVAAVPLSSEELVRLRESLGQLATGMTSLHSAGVLHRDVKPGNVLVKPTGRVVLLDFGLAGEIPPDGLYHSSPGQVCGTVAYMAPEQAAGSALTPAADWYAFGVVLYELLAGRLPFSGTVWDVLRDKQRSDPPPPSQFRAGVPPDLGRLCLGLLHRDPTRRPGGADIHRLLGAACGSLPPAREGQTASGVRLIGREDHLRVLGEAFAAVRRGVAVCARVHGPSGIGKSALARAFLDRLSEEGAVALAGRCYEQEQVPYKAFDGVIDALSQHLAGRPDAEAAALLPRDPGALARLFPVLGRVPAVAAAPPGRAQAPDPREARRRGLGALRELLTRLGDRRPLVVFVDDLQWGDADSAVLLDELLRPPDPPSLMVILCYRSEDAADSVPLQAVRRIIPVPPALQMIDLPVDSLPAHDARALAEHLLSGVGGPAEGLAEAIAQQAMGNPFYVGELAEAARTGMSVTGTESLDRLLWDRSRGLSPDARRLLELVVVAGRPVRQDFACRAAGTGVNFHATQAVLRAGRLIRGIGLAGEEQIAPYHDRVRQAVLAYLPPEDRRAYHLSLARGMEREGEQDAEFLALHYYGAGELEIAAGHYAEAGAEAAAATAFNQAARLFRLAADLGVWPTEQLARLRAREADALANAGRGAAAAEAYLAAAALAIGDAADEWRRQAAEQYLVTGHFDVGLRLLREVVVAAGLTFPATPLRAILGFLWGRLRLRLRGIGFRPRPPEAVPLDELRRVDVCWSASTGLSVTDTIRGAYFQTRGLLHSLRVGEPGRVVRALALGAVHAAVTGPSADRVSGALIEAADVIVAGTSEPYSRGIVFLSSGMCEFLAGRFRRGADMLRSAELTFRDSCTQVTWELDTARTWWLLAQIFLGHWADLAREWPALLRDAQDRGDLYAEVYLSTFILATVRLAADEPDHALGEVRAAMARWSPSGFHVQHHNEVVATVLVRLYQCDGASAWNFIRDKERLYRRAMLWRVQQVRTDFLQLRARSALAAAHQSADPSPLLRSAERDALTLERESAAWAQALGCLLRACVHATRPRTNRPDLFATAATRLEAADLGAFAAAARYRQGQRTGGDEGRRLRDGAVAWLASQDVRDPLRIISSHAPTPGGWH
jgi:hypothetical protein